MRNEKSLQMLSVALALKIQRPREKMKLASIHIRFIEAFLLAPQTLNHQNLSCLCGAWKTCQESSSQLHSLPEDMLQHTCLIHSSKLDAMTIRKQTQIQINSLKCNYSKSASMTSHGLCKASSTTAYRTGTANNQRRKDTCNLILPLYTQ